MVENNQFKQQDLFEQVSRTENLLFGFKSVKKNGGAPGIDGVTVTEFGNNLDAEIRKLSKEIEEWTYKPNPVKLVLIPKSGGGKRRLGIPCVRDRVVQATIKQILEPIFEQGFSNNSYGFRPGRSQKQAVLAAKEIVKRGKSFVVDIDLAQFFDRIHHQRLIHRIGNTIRDKRIQRLIGLTLKSGVMENGLSKQTEQGSVQGSPLSPLLSNIVLDELDKELEKRGVEFCRYADDCNVFVKTRKAAERVMGRTRTFIQTKLKLEVNAEKSKVARSDKVKFLGFTLLLTAAVAISAGSMRRATAKVRDLIPRGTSETIIETVNRTNRWYRGWSNYYGLTEYQAQLRNVEAHIRRRLRSRIISQMKRQRYLYRELCARGLSEKYASETAYSKKGKWAKSHMRESRRHIRISGSLKNWDNTLSQIRKESTG